MNNIEFYLADAIDVIEEVLSSGGEFRLYPKGTSMLPLIVQGRDSVILRKNKDRLKNKDIALYRRSNGQFVLHRVVKIEKDGTYTMCGDNQTMLERGIKNEQIIAYVDRVYHGEKVLCSNSFKYRVYLFFWCCIPLRRILRFLRKCAGRVKRFFLKMFQKKD